MQIACVWFLERRPDSANICVHQFPANISIKYFSGRQIKKNSDQVSST